MVIAGLTTKFGDVRIVEANVNCDRAGITVEPPVITVGRMIDAKESSGTRWACDLRGVEPVVVGIAIHLGASNGRFLRHRFSPKPTSVATTNSLPKRNHVAKEAVSAA